MAATSIYYSEHEGEWIEYDHLTGDTMFLKVESVKQERLSDDSFALIQNFRKDLNRGYFFKTELELREEGYKFICG